MKHIFITLFMALLPIGGLPPQAQAQWAVYDPANHVQNILQAVRALQEINNQIQQLTNEIQMLQNMADDLRSEERRVGKEGSEPCESRWAPEQEKKNKQRNTRAQYHQ